MTNPLRMAVIGVGRIGNNHARILADMDDVELVAVVDTNKDQVNRIGNRYRVHKYTTIDDLFGLEQLDAVCICVPTVNHYEVARRAISEKVHLLVEKPIALTIEQGREIITAAEEAGVTLTVGHVERFNPAVIALRQRIAKGELGRVFQVEAHRASPFPTHVLDVGVVIDLAVHDLDVMRYITGSEITRIFAEVRRQVHPSHEDQLIGLFRFADDTIGKVTVNWLTPTKVRELIVLGELGMFVVNYITQDLTFYENTAVESTDWDTMGVLRGVNEGPMIRYVVPKKEPLRAELEAFTQAIREGSPPIVSGMDGVQALAIAETLIKAGESHTALELAD